MAEYRITYWREIPSMVTARDGAATSKAALPGRFQEAIDEAAMRQGMAGSDAYLEQWHHGEWEPADGTPDQLVHPLGAARQRLRRGAPRIAAGGVMGQIATLLGDTRPALSDGAVLCVPSTQSDSTKPRKPQSPLRMSPSRCAFWSQ